MSPRDPTAASSFGGRGVREGGREEGIPNSVPQPRFAPSRNQVRSRSQNLLDRGRGERSAARHRDSPVRPKRPPRHLPHFSELQATPLTRLLELRLWDQLLHSRVPQTRKWGGRQGWGQSRDHVTSAAPSPSPRGADTSTKMAATPKPAWLLLRGRGLLKKPISAAWEV